MTFRKLVVDVAEESKPLKAFVAVDFVRFGSICRVQEWQHNIENKSPLPGEKSGNVNFLQDPHVFQNTKSQLLKQF